MMVDWMHFCLGGACSNICEVYMVKSAKSMVICMFDCVIAIIRSVNSCIDQYDEIWSVFVSNQAVNSMYSDPQMIFILIIAIFVESTDTFIQLNHTFMFCIVSNDNCSYYHSCYKIVYYCKCLRFSICLTMRMCISLIGILELIIYDAIKIIKFQTMSFNSMNDESQKRFNNYK